MSLEAMFPDRLPPNAFEAEQAVLGAALISGRAAQLVADELARDDFYTRAHGLIWEACCYVLQQRGQPPDVLTVPEELRRQGVLDQCGGVAYVNMLASAVPTASHVEHYLRIVQEASTLRKLQRVVREIDGNIEARALEVDEILDLAEREVLAVGKARRADRLTTSTELAATVMLAVEQAQARPDHLTGIPTGFSDVDAVMCGMQPKDLIICAGRPSMGKTALATGVGMNAAKFGATTAIFSLEMPKEVIGQRIVVSEAEIPMHRLRSGHLGDVDLGYGTERDRLARAAGQLGELPLLIEDAPGLTALDIRAMCRRQKRDGGLDLVIIDYLQWIRPHQRLNNRNLEIGETCRVLKEMGSELEVPVLCLAQLSRNSERRQDHRPLLSDLRESGEIEQTADVVWLLHRPEYYERGEREQPSEDAVVLAEDAELIIGKHRNGWTGTLHLGYRGRYMRFENLARHLSEPPAAVAPPERRIPEEVLEVEPWFRPADED